MKELSPPEFSFVITQEMIEGDEYPKLFYKRVCQLVSDRNAIFLPIRLECDESELVKRVGDIRQRDLFKTIDTERASNLTRNYKVFYTKHLNELTIDNSHLLPEQVALLILEQLDKLVSEKS